ncbi:MAG: FtsK/SpoIIIE domain-containing protein [Eubacteriales bacterium]|nr:FtsK/SpoIIIE domain-containing protein [Eubacteriales bacterium]
MADFVLPLTKDLLKYHTRWNERSLRPYTDELFDLWAENGIDGLLDTQLQGPTLTRFGIIPDDRKSADRIVGLLPTYKAIFNRSDVQVYRADGHVYIDVPWQTDQVFLGDILLDDEYERLHGYGPEIPVAIGMDIYRQSYFADLAQMPHLLVAGQGRTAFLHGVIISLLLSHAPEDIEVYLCGQRRSEFDKYNRIPYCQVSSDPNDQIILLEDLNAEVDRRYAAMYESRCRTIYDFNRRAGKMKHLIIIIEEYANLVAINKRAAASNLTRLAEMAAACGIHLITASEKSVYFRPVRDSFPSRVCLRTDTVADSYVMIDRKGAEKLGKKGMLFYLDGSSATPYLLQSGSVSAKEIRAVVSAIMDNYADPSSKDTGPTLWDKLFSR